MGNVVGVIVGGVLHVTGSALHSVQSFVHHLDEAHHGQEWLEPLVDGNTVGAVENTVYDCDEKAKDETTAATVVVHWKPLKAWMQHYEPLEVMAAAAEGGDVGVAAVAEPSKLQQAEQRVIQRTKHRLVNVMQRRMMRRILRLVLDVSSSALTLVEEKLRQRSGGGHDNNLTDSTLSTAAAMINNINGIVLTYRFQGAAEKHMMEYIRRKATDSLTALLWEVCRKVDDDTNSGDDGDNATTHAKMRILALQKTLHDTISSVEDEICENILVTHLDAMLEQAQETLQSKAKKAVHQAQTMTTNMAVSFEERLVALDVVAQEAAMAVNEKVQAVEMLDIEIINGTNSIGGAAVAVASPTEGLQLQHATIAKERQLLAAQQGLVDKAAQQNIQHLDKTTPTTSIGQAIRDYILSQLHQSDDYDDRPFTTRLLWHVDCLLLEYYELYTRMAASSQQKEQRHSLKELQDKMYTRVDRMFQELYDRVNYRVSEATNALGALMVHHDKVVDEEIALGRDNMDLE